MDKNRDRVFVLAAILLVVFSVIAFVLPFFQRNAVFWLAYVFGVLAIAAQLYVLKASFRKGETVRSKFYGFPIARVGVIYLAVQLVLSLLFMMLAPVVPVWLAVVLFVLVLAAAAVGFIGTDAMRDEIERQDVKFEADTSCMTTLRSIVYTLPGQSDSPAAKAALQQLADEFRYSDPVSGESLKAVEEDLETAVSGLQAIVRTGDAKNIAEECSRVSALLAERNRLCKLNKRR